MLTRIITAAFSSMLLGFILPILQQPAQAHHGPDYRDLDRVEHSVGRTRHAIDRGDIRHHPGIHKAKRYVDVRQGYQADGYIEKGPASVTDSPIFPDGLRLVAGRPHHKKSLRDALASAIYLLDIPSKARTVKIHVSYEAKAPRGHGERAIGGRVFVRAAPTRGSGRTDRHAVNRHGSQFVGGTFLLDADAHHMVLTVPARAHASDGIVELHIVATDGQRIDVSAIKVKTYPHPPNIAVVDARSRGRGMRMWHDDTYSSVYAGPLYRYDGDRYVRYPMGKNKPHHVGHMQAQYDSRWGDSSVRRTSLIRHGMARTHLQTRPYYRWDRGQQHRWSSEHAERWKGLDPVRP